MRALVFPVVGKTTICSPYGDPRGIGYHHGIDACAPMNTPILAPDSGSVRFGHDPMGGNVILVDGDGGGTWYLAHASAFNGEDRAVEAGDVVGFVGMTGNAVGTVPHVHVEAWPTGVYTSFIDPTPMLSAAQRFASPPTSRPAPLGVGKALLVGAGIVGLSALLALAMRATPSSMRRRTSRA